MIIELNGSLTLLGSNQYTRDDDRQAEYVQRTNVNLARKINKQIEGTLIPVRPVTSTGDMYENGLLGIASRAYSRHYGLEIGPHNLWHIVLTQLAEQINENSEACRHLFTKSDEKILILVEQDHPTDINVESLMSKVQKLLPIDSALFLPDLSTHTDQSRLACAAAFADALRQYYEYGMFCCGIPRVRLTGTIIDWNLLFDNVNALIDVFSPIQRMQATVKYLERVREVFYNIVRTIELGAHNIEDLIEQFWKNVFTQKNVGSGGDLTVNGWLTSLYFNRENGDQMIKSFHNTLSILPYTNVSTGEQFVMMHGAYHANVTEGDILQAQYDHATFRIEQ